MAALISLDPGLDEAGFAVLAFPALGTASTSRQVLTWGGAVGLGYPPLLEVGTWYCPPGAELEVRLRRHAEEVIRVLSGQGDAITHAVIERPVTSTVYAAHRRGGATQQTKMARSREVQELVTGVLWRTLEARGVTAHFAAPTRKAFRSIEVLKRLYPAGGKRPDHSRATRQTPGAEGERMARKVVINACFGGFGLSDAAYERLITLGIPVRKYAKQELGADGRYSQPPENTGEIIFDRELTPPGEDELNDKMYHAFKGKDSRIFGNRYWDSWTDRNREHPLLIQVVEEMGAAANGVRARLKIVEIPDDVEYTIEEYDGNEHIAEAHRTWA